MAGLLRNLLTVLLALARWNSTGAQSEVVSWFWITPLDTGLTTLKSDRYFQLAEAAQFDFVARTPLAGRIWAARARYVNVAQMAQFMRPVRMFDRVSVRTQVAWADERHGYFTHVFSVGPHVCAQVWVKMKFKQGRLTIPPARMVGEFTADKPQPLERWDAAL